MELFFYSTNITTSKSLNVLNFCIKNILTIIFTIALPISNSFSQELYKELPFPYYYNKTSAQNPLELVKTDPLNNFNKFITPLKQALTNNSNLIDSIIFSSTTGSERKFTFTYDDSGRIVSFVLWDLFNNTWENSSRISNVFDSVGNILSILYEFWNGNSWNNDINENFTYDSAGNNISHLIQYWNDDRWENQLIIYNTYDSNQNIILSITQRLADSLWINSSKTTNSYSPDGLRDSSFFYIWWNDHWESYWLQMGRYNENKDLASLLTKIWNRNKWENYALVKLTYEINEPQITGGMVFWDGSNWINDSRYFYSFNDEKYFTHGKCESWENESWVPGEGSIDISNPDGFELHLLTHEAFVYYHSTTDVATEGDLNPNEFVLYQNYPNPFNPTTKIKYSVPSVGTSFMKFVQLKVYDILGNEVATLVNEEQPAGNYEVEFNAASGITNLASGIYFYKLTVGSFVQTKKMILLK